MCKRDLVGQTFGLLTVISSFEDEATGKKDQWACRCSCDGKTVVKLGSSLIRGAVRSCGCLYKNPGSVGLSEISFANPLRVVYTRYKGRAKRKGLRFEWSQKEAKELFSRPCFYCGQEPSNLVRGKKPGSDFYYNGLDRYDNSLGYTKNNTITCCEKCNILKGTLHGDLFLEQVMRIQARHAGEIGDKCLINEKPAVI